MEKQKENGKKRKKANKENDEEIKLFEDQQEYYVEVFVFCKHHWIDSTLNCSAWQK